MDDLIKRQAAINAVEFGITYAKAIDVNTGESKELFKEGNDALKKASERIKDLPSAQPEPLSDAYTKAVWTWLLDYQIKAAELKGRYTPYEVLSWVANDWRKEHE